MLKKTSPVLRVKAPGSKPASGRALLAHTRYPALGWDSREGRKSPEGAFTPLNTLNAFPEAPKFLLLHLGSSWEWIPLNDTKFWPPRDLQVFLLSKQHGFSCMEFSQSTGTMGTLEMSSATSEGLREPRIAESQSSTNPWVLHGCAPARDL